jgi:hypothetical protein
MLSLLPFTLIAKAGIIISYNIGVSELESTSTAFKG